MRKLLFIVLFLPQLANARKFYFSTSGSDGYSVTQAQNSATPWASLVNLHKFANGSSPFGAAPNRAAAGDTFLFKCGDVFTTGFGNSNDDFGVVKWWNGVSGYTAPTGTAANPIVFTSYGTGAKPNLLFPYPTAVIGRNRYVLNFKNVGYLYFDNLQFNDIRFPVNDKVTSAYTCSGFMIGESNASICNNIKVTNCNFSNTCYGIRSCVNVMEISNNTFTNFKSCGDTIGINDIGADALQPSGYKYLIKNNLIQGSWAYANPSSSSQGKLGGGLEAINDFDSSLIIYNTFFDNSGAMEFGQNAGTQYGCNDDTFAFNKFINNSVVCYINVTGTFACTASNMHFWNNVVIENGNSRQTGANFGQDVLGDGQSFTTWSFWNAYPLNPTVNNPTGWRPFQYGSDAGVVADTLYDIRNNVIWNTNGLVMKYSGRTKIKYGYNVYRVSGGSSVGATLDAGELNTINKIFVDTISSVNPINWDFHLQNGSPAINTGTYLGVSPDWAGAVVTNPPSIGIYNYTVAATVPILTTTAASSISYTTASSGGSVTSDGGAIVTRRGLMYSTSAITDTTTGTKVIDGGVGIGSYVTSLTGLTSSTTYHVRAFAINSAGIAWGNDLTFVTLTPPTLATIITTPATSITGTTATSGGNVTLDGGATVYRRGLIYSTSVIIDTNSIVGGGKIISGTTGTGSFTSSLTLLTAGVNYHVRAFALNSAGVAYGADLTFTTTSIPTLTTLLPTSILYSTASSGGNISSDGGSPITRRGLMYSTSPITDTTTGTKVINGSVGTGSYVTTLTGLSSATTYHVRAFAVNSVGVSYGLDLTFTTLVAPVLPIVTFNGFTRVGANVSVSGYITSEGSSPVTRKGFIYSTSPLTYDTSLYSKVGINGGGIGFYGTTLTGLTPNTFYYILSWAVNSVGISFSDNTYGTGFVTANFPTITTLPPTSIVSTSATVGFNLTDEGGTPAYERGIMYSTSPIADTTSGTKITFPFLTGTGSYSFTLTGLSPLTTYHVRAFALNAIGVAYGLDLTFTTLAAASLPIVVANSPTSVTSNSAILAGDVKSDGNASVYRRGFVYSTSPITDTTSITGGGKIISGSGLGTYSSTISSLALNTTYYVKAFALNYVGVSYSSEVYFSTSGTPPSVNSFRTRKRFVQKP